MTTQDWFDEIGRLLEGAAGDVKMISTVLTGPETLLDTSRKAGMATEEVRAIMLNQVYSLEPVLKDLGRRVESLITRLSEPVPKEVIPIPPDAEEETTEQEAVQ